MKDKKSNPGSFDRSNPLDGSPDELKRLAGEMPDDQELKDLLAQWSAPESFAALDHQVMTAYRERSRPSFWRQLLTASIRVPVPVLAAAVLFIILSTAVTLRVLNHEPQLVIQSAPMVAPVKIVWPIGNQPEATTRIVYVEKKAGSKCEESNNLPARQSRGLSNALYGGQDETGYFTHGDLSGFQPAEEMSFKVIKKESK